MFNKASIKKWTRWTGPAAVGLLLGWLLFGGTGSAPVEQPEQHNHAEQRDESRETVYTCSMHPQVRQPEPGNCPICGMELIPADEGGAASVSSDQLEMTEEAVKLARVQTTTASLEQPVQTARMPGKVQVDERRLSSITAHFPGRIKQMYVNYTGEYVEKGEKLASIYSPQLITAQKELLEALKYRESNPSLYKAARRKLELWELPQSEIDRIVNEKELQTEVDIVSPVSGYVLKRNVARQDHVMEGTVMYQVADLSHLWVHFDAYESDLAGLSEGDAVKFNVQAYPGQTFRARISYIDPVINEGSRTATVRAELDNPQGRLKPGMLAEGITKNHVSGGEQLVIPRSAVLWTGERSLVYVKVPNTDNPTFEAREVTLGKRVGDAYIIRDGLEAGEEVVTNGTFAVDSAAQLADKRSMMNRNPGQGARTGHNHGEMSERTPGPSEERRNTVQRQESHDITADTDKASTVPEAFKAQVSVVVEVYLGLKDALVESKGHPAMQYADSLQAALEQVDMSLLKGEIHMTWMEQLKTLREAATTIAGTHDLNLQRKAFGPLSDTMTEAAKTYGVGNGLYRQFCPMAFGGDGGYWLSRSERISNPYYGEAMLRCGSTIETIGSQ